MRVTTHWAVGVLAGAAVLILAPAAAPAAGERPGFETYVVRRGDTLSGIAGRVFGDAKRWREILKENPQVTNPNLIFPGDALLLPAPEPAVAVPADLPVERGRRSRGGAKPPLPRPRKRAPRPRPSPAWRCPTCRLLRSAPSATIQPALYRSAGYIADGLPAVAIVAAEDERELLGTDDAAIVNAPIAPGGTFAVVRVDRRVFHPLTGQYLGWLTRVLGTAEVTCRDLETSTDRPARHARRRGRRRLPRRARPERHARGERPPGQDAAGVRPARPGRRRDRRLRRGPARGRRARSRLPRPGHRAPAPPPAGATSSTARRAGVAGPRSARSRCCAPREETATALVTSSLGEMLVGDLLRAR